MSPVPPACSVTCTVSAAPSATASSVVARSDSPPANLSQEVEGVIPADGVYAGWVVRAVPGTQSAEFLPAAISVGTNPQFNGEERTVEAHVLGRSDLNLYGERIAVTFVSRIRPMLSSIMSTACCARWTTTCVRRLPSVGIGVAGRVDPDSVTAS